MAGRSGALALTLLALCLAVTTAQRRAVLSVSGQPQVELGNIEVVHQRMMRDLKEAQEKAGIFVDDAHLFENLDLEEVRQARKLQQDADLASLVSSVPLTQILSAFAGLPAGSTTGVFPAAAFPGLTNANPFGYSPTNDSFCLFSTSPTPSTTGRKLQQAPSPLSDLIDAALSAIGLPIWNCVVATTPVGVTTVGDAAGAVLNDLGLLAEHLLVYLNGNGDLTYQQNVINDFVSLQNPLYPSGPRLNISIDFASVAKDIPILDELFPKGSSSSPGAAPAASPAAGPGGSPSGGGGSPSSPTDVSTVVSSPAASVAVAVSGPTSAPSVSVTVKVYDGYLDQCQVVIGSLPHADGNFDRTNNYTGTIVDGTWDMSMESQNEFAGDVGYVIPASKVLTYSPLTLATRGSATYCYDIASLQPVYNPLAVYLENNATAYSANPLSTIAVFGSAFGLTESALITALNLPAVDIYSYDALGNAVNGSAEGLTVLKASIQASNTVTLGATTLTNDSSTYASYAIIVDQSIAQKILYSPPTGGRKLLQAAPAVDMTNATTVASIIAIGQQAAPTQSDEATRNALNNLTPDLINAVSGAVANINTVTANCQNATCVEVASFYTETTLAEEVTALYSGTISLADFEAETTVPALTTAVANTALPGELIPTPITPTTGSTVTPITQSSTTSSSGLSHGGKVALATILPIVGVIAIVAAIAFYMTRRNRGNQIDTPAGGRVWWSSMFHRGGSAASSNTV